MVDDTTGQEFTREDVLEAASMSRRRLLSTLAAGGMATVAGCSGDDGGTPTETDATLTTPTGTPSGPGESTPAETGTTAPGTDPGQADTATGEDTATPTPEPTTDIYSIVGQEVDLAQAHMNQWNSKTGWAPPWYGNPPFLQGTDYGQFLAGLVQGYDYTGESVTIGPFNEGFEYHDGAAFDPKIWIRQQKRLMEPNIQVSAQTFNRSVFSYENLRLAEGDRGTEVRYDFAGEGNPTLLFLQTMRRDGMSDDLKTHPDLHSQFLKEAKQATSKSAKISLVQRLVNQYQIPIADGVKQMGVEPGELRSFSRSMVVVEYREPYATESYPWGYGNEHNTDVNYWYRAEWGDKPKMAGIISIPFIEDFETNSRNVILNAAIAGKIDTIQDVWDPTVIKQFPEGWRVIPNTPEQTPGICFSPGSMIGKKTERARKIRKAIAYLVDPGEFSKVASFPPPAHKVSGIPYPQLERAWLGSPSEYSETFTNYGSAATGWVKKKKGYSLLRKAGMERRNGQWIDTETGKPWTPTFIYSSSSATQNAIGHAKNLSEQLKRHGITVDENNASSSGMQTLVGTEAGRKKWDIALLGDQLRQQLHPYFGFQNDCGLGSSELGAPIGPGDFRNGYARVEVPMPVGDPDGSLQEVNYDRMVRKLGKVKTPEEERKLIRKICWTINQWVPIVAPAIAPDMAAININKFQPKIPLDHNGWSFGPDLLIDIGALDVDPEYNPSMTPVDSTAKNF